MAEVTNPITADGDYPIDVYEGSRYALAVNYTAGTGTIKLQWVFDEGNMDIPGASFTADGAVEIVAVSRKLNVNVASASSLSANVHIAGIVEGPL
jgi:hypothetical protein